MLLTVELSGAEKDFPDALQIMIYCDQEGLDLLIDNLNYLKRSGGKGEHVHLMTPAWAGDELTETRVDEDDILINHVKIVLKPNEL